MQKEPKKVEKSNVGPTDQPTDRLTNKVGYRVEWVIELRAHD